MGVQAKGHEYYPKPPNFVLDKNITKAAMDKGSIEFEQVVERGCGLDVHKENVVATIQGKSIKTMTKSYSTFTGSLEKLRAWLKKHGITHIAMESTGVYWRPIFNVLGDDFEILRSEERRVGKECRSRCELYLR